MKFSRFTGVAGILWLMVAQPLIAQDRPEPSILRHADPHRWKVEGNEGASKKWRFRYRVKSKSILRIWARSEQMDLTLEIESDQRDQSWKDDDSGAWKAPFLEIGDGQANETLTITVRAKELAEGELAVQVFESPLRDDLDDLIEDATETLAEVDDLLKTFDIAEARDLVREIVKDCLTAKTRDSIRIAVEVLWPAAKCAVRAKDIPTSARVWRAVRQIQERTLPADHLDLAKVRDGHALALNDLGRLEEALTLQKKILETYERTLSTDDLEFIRVRHNLAISLSDLDRDKEALAVQRQVLEARKRILPALHVDVAKSLFNLGVTLLRLDRTEEALPFFRQGVEIFEGIYSDADPALVTGRNNLALILVDLGRREEALALQLEILESLERASPADHPRLVSARQSLAATLESLGRVEEALSLRLQVFETRGRTLAADHPDLDRARHELGHTLSLLGRNKEALTHQRLVFEWRTRTLPAEHSDLISARWALANTLFLLERTAEALPLQRQLLELLERTLPGDHVDLAGARVNLANGLRMLGRPKEALVLERMVLATYERSPPADPLVLASARGNLGLTLKDLGMMEESLTLMRQALVIRERHLPANHSDLIKAHENLAEALTELGRLDEALLLNRQVLEAKERTLPADDPALTHARTILANTLDSLGSRREALALRRQVLATQERTLTEEDPDLASARHNVALSLFGLGQVRKALTLQQQVLEMRERTLTADHPDLARARENLSATLSRLGRSEEAIVFERQVLEVRERTLPADHLDLITAQHNLAADLSLQGRLDEALELQREILGAWRRKLPAAHPHLDGARHNLARTLSLLGRPQEALVLERQNARATIRMIDEFADSMSFESLAALASSRRDLMSWSLSALRLSTDPRDLAIAFELVEACSNLSTVGLSLQRRFDFGASDELRRLRVELNVVDRELIGVLTGNAAKGTDPGMVIRKKKKLMLSMQKALKVSGGWERPDFRANAIAAKIEEGQAALRFFDYDRLEQEGESTRKSVNRGRHVLAFVLRRNGSVGLVEFGRLDEVRSAIESWRRLVRKEAETENARARRSLAIQRRQSEAVLRRILVEPLLAAVNGCDTITLALDGVLHGLPWEAVPAGDNGKLLGDLVRVQYRTSLKELTVPPPAVTERGELLTLGDLDFDAVVSADEPKKAPSNEDGSGEQDSRVSSGKPRNSVALRAISRSASPRHREGRLRFEALRASGTEVDVIDALYRTSRGAAATVSALRGKAGTVETLRSIAPRARYVHLATHAYFLPEKFKSVLDREPALQDEGLNRVLRTLDGPTARVTGALPMALCGIALSGANIEVARDKEGLLDRRYSMSGIDVAHLDLSNCELAVLSACEGNVGVTRLGRGIASLQEALQIAGARTVVTSLWKVPDESTKALMIEFYRQMWIEKKGKADALWAAKQKMRMAKRDDGSPEYALYDWAGWVMTGDPE